MPTESTEDRAVFQLLQEAHKQYERYIELARLSAAPFIPNTPEAAQRQPKFNDIPLSLAVQTKS
jgi:hypothetical protein